MANKRLDSATGRTPHSTHLRNVSRHTAPTILEVQMARDMGEVGDYQRVREDKVYPWPCEPQPNRTIQLFNDDILTRSKDGTFVKHTGICCAGIVIPESDIIEVKGDKRHLYIM